MSDTQIDRAALAVFVAVEGRQPTQLPVGEKYYKVARAAVREVLKARRNDVDDHPEDSCDRCGGNNPSWAVDSDRWNTAVGSLGLTPAVVLCPGCFVDGHERATGMTASWDLAPATPFRFADYLTEEET